MTDAGSAPVESAPSATGSPAATTGATSAPPPAATSTASDWTTGLSDDIRGYVQNKGFKDPATVVDSYRNLEKLLGAPKEKLLRLPEKDDADGWNQVYSALGRPEKPEDYKVQGDPEFSKWAQGTFHKLGLTAEQAANLTKEFGAFSEGISKNQQTQMQAKIQQEASSLKSEWGAAYDQNLNAAKRAANQFGIGAETIDSLEKAMGYAGVMKFMHTLGSKIGEDSFVSGKGNGSSFGALTPDAAKSKIAELRSDRAFIQKYAGGDREAREEMAKLHQFAYPDSI